MACEFQPRRVNKNTACSPNRFQNHHGALIRTGLPEAFSATAVSNYIRRPTRPEFIAHRDFTPIQTVDDDALLRLARAQRQAAE